MVISGFDNICIWSLTTACGLVVSETGLNNTPFRDDFPCHIFSRNETREKWEQADMFLYIHARMGVTRGFVGLCVRVFNGIAATIALVTSNHVSLYAWCQPQTS